MERMGSIENYLLRGKSTESKFLLIILNLRFLNFIIVIDKLVLEAEVFIYLSIKLSKISEEIINIVILL